VYESRDDHRAQPQSFLHCALQPTQSRGQEGCHEKGEGEVFQCLLLPEKKPAQATVLVLFLLLRKCQDWYLLLQVLLTRALLSHGAPGSSGQLIPSLC